MSDELSRRQKITGVGLGFGIPFVSGVIAISVKWPMDAPTWMANPQALWGWLVGMSAAYGTYRLAKYLDNRWGTEGELQ